MKKSLFFPFILLLLFVVNGGAQINVPQQLSANSKNKEKINFSSVFSNYQALKSSQDTLLKRDKKIAERWMHNEKSRININEDGTLDFNDYSEAFKLFVENGPYCNDGDISDWENIGPREVGQYNGWVSAVYYNPHPLSNYYLIGARSAGIFKSEDNGASWNCVTDNLDYPVLGIQQIIVNPNQSSNLFAVTGVKSGVEAVQNGYLWSVDNGNTWYLGAKTLNDGTPISQIQKIGFHEVSNTMFALTENQIIISNDDGQSWDLLSTYPSDLVVTEGVLQDMAIANNKIHITQTIKYAFHTKYWSGDIIGSGTNIDVNWSMENSLQFYPPVGFQHIEDAHPYTKPGSIIGPSIQPAQEPNGYHHRNSTNSGCGYNGYPHYNDNVGPWDKINTPGWDAESIGGINKAVCVKSGQTFDGSEVTLDNIALPISDWLSSDLKVDLKCFLPKGCRLKAYLSSYNFSMPINNPPTYPWSLCQLDNYDNNTLFENEIISSGWSSGSGTASFENFINLYSLNINDPVPTSNNGITFNLYFRLEFNSDYIPGEKFILEEFDISEETPKVNFIDFSNVVDERFYVLSAKGGKFQTIYKTTDSGQSFLPITKPGPAPYSAVSDVGGPAKSELIASVVDPNIFYYGSTHSPKRYTEDGIELVGSPVSIGGNGHHPDYRSSHISELNGEDFIVFGNDGGVAKSPNANLSVPSMLSLNGNIILNMVHNFDVHEKTSRVLVGLQDNGSRVFNKVNVNMQSVNPGDGDGCVAKIRTDGNNFVTGDPQFGGASSVRDSYIPGYQDNGIVADNLYLDIHEVYLGMRLEAQRFDDSKFICGLGKKEGAAGASVLVNSGVDMTNTHLVEQSQQIGSVAICQRNPKFMYAADGAPRDFNNTRLYKSTDEGITWTNLNSTLNLSTGSISLENDIAWKFINALGVDHDDSNLVYIGMSGVGKINDQVTNEYFRVLKSIDGGVKFDDWSRGLPALPVNYLLPIESENHIVFCATDAGIYYRMDGMERWECFSNNLAKTRITDLSYNYCSRELFASSYGRGVWQTPVNLDTYSTYSEDIVGNVVWNTDRDVRSNIRVKSGSTLTIQSKVHIDADRRFIVEPRAKLIIDGGTLTNDCGQYWLGIEVWGDASANQIFAHQGHLITRNDSKIEYAKEAVAIWKRGDWSKTGGIVTLQNTEFVNNRTSVFFYPYHNYNTTNGNEIINKGAISNCKFIWDDNYIDESPEAGVILFHVFGPRISGSDFIDDRSNLATGNTRPAGVFSLDAGYSVVSRATSQNQDIHEVFDVTGGYDVNNFENLEYGIHALNSETPYSITMDHCKFTNVKHAAQISAVDNAVISRNLVEFNLAHPQDIASSQGFGINESTGYFIQGNTFTSEDPEAFTAGILTTDSGDAENIIRKNYYNDLSLANYAYGINSNATQINVNNQNFKGLQWLCNEYNNNKYDEASFTLSDDYGQGVRLVQGSPEIPAGNIFTDLNYPQLNAQLFSSSQFIMQYHYNDASSSLAEPTILGQNGFYYIQYEPNENECASTFNGSVDGLSKNIFDSQMKKQPDPKIHKMERIIESKQSLLSNNSDSLEVKEILDLQNEIAKLANTMITNMLAQNEINWSDLQKYILLRNNSVHLAELTDMFSSSQKSDNRIESLNTLDKYISEIEIPYIQQEMIDFATFKRYILSISDEKGIVHTLQDKEIEKLSYMADNFTGRSAIQARNMLCFHAGLCKENEVILPSEKSSAMIVEDKENDTHKTESQELIVTPNPTNGKFILSVPEACEIESLKIFDAQGNSILFKSEIISQHQMSINLNQTHSGVIFLYTQCTNSTMFTTTVVIEN